MKDMKHGINQITGFDATAGYPRWAAVSARVAIGDGIDLWWKWVKVDASRHPRSGLAGGGTRSKYLCLSVSFFNPFLLLVFFRDNKHSDVQSQLSIWWPL